MILDLTNKPVSDMTLQQGKFRLDIRRNFLTMRVGQALEQTTQKAVDTIPRHLRRS